MAGPYDLVNGLCGFPALRRMDRIQSNRESARFLRASAGPYSTNDGHDWADNARTRATELEKEADALESQATKSTYQS